MSPILLGASILVIIVFAMQIFCDVKLRMWQRILWIISFNILVTESIKNILNVVFGRLWPATWINNNPSWLDNQEYGFYFFKGWDDAYRSFSSGHTAIVFAAMSVLWILYPKLRIVSVLSCFMVITGLLANYYHFLGDIIAGAYLGIFTGIIAARICMLQHRY